MQWILQVCLQVMITISDQIIIYLRYKLAEKYELAGIKKYSIDEEQAWCPGSSWNFCQILYNAVNRHQVGHVRSWIWVSLMVEVWEMVGLGRPVNRAWKKAGPFFQGDPLGRRIHQWERKESAVPQGKKQKLWKQLWQHQALVPSEMLCCKGLIFFPGFQPVLAMCSLNSQIHFIRNLTTEEIEAFLHSVTTSVMDWWGVGAGPALSARTNNISGPVELTWHCIFS